MSARLQAKRARFAASRRRHRKYQAIFRRNENRPGFLGVCYGLFINGKRVAGMGAAFIDRVSTP